MTKKFSELPMVTEYAEVQKITYPPSFQLLWRFSSFKLAKTSANKQGYMLFFYFRKYVLKEYNPETAIKSFSPSVPKLNTCAPKNISR